MSLINDALKRAKQTQPDPSRPSTPGGAMQPVDYQRRSLPWYFFPTVVVILCGGCWFLIKGWDNHRQAVAGYGNPITVKAREPLTPIVPEATPAPTTEKPFTPAVNHSPSTPFTTVNRNFSLEDSPAASAEPPAASAPAPSTAAAPMFKLQGIFYRNASPSAMVNGKSVFIGDRVSGARVKAIDRESVTLEYEGQTKTLTLE